MATFSNKPISEVLCMSYDDNCASDYRNKYVDTILVTNVFQLKIVFQTMN